MVAFGAALSILLKERRVKWPPIPIDILACIPITSFIHRNGNIQITSS
jgi:hypothetical protein